MSDDPVTKLRRLSVVSGSLFGMGLSAGLFAVSNGHVLISALSLATMAFAVHGYRNGKEVDLNTLKSAGGESP